jgi:PDZ domain/Aspartyl protease
MISQKLAATIAAAVLLTVSRAMPGAPAVVPFELINRHIVIGATVNGSAPLSFVLDTGDKLAIVDLGRARQLGLALGREARVGGLGSSQLTGYFVTGATVTVPAVPRAAQPVVLALPLAPLASRLGHDFDGLLGADFIRQFVVEIDYAARTVTLHDPAEFHYTGSGEVVSIHFNAAGHPVIQASVTPLGGEPIAATFLVDIGAGTGVSLHSPFAAAHHLPAAADPTIRAIGIRGAGGEGSGRFGRLASFRIGALTLSRPLALFSEDTAGAFANAAIDGNVGYDILRRFRVFLDYTHERMILEPAAGFDAPFARPMTGFVFETAPADFHRFTVTAVLQSSPASEAGVRAGDEIAAIDGRPASDLTLTAIADLFEQPVARRLRLRRGGQVVEVVLTPRVLVG